MDLIKKFLSKKQVSIPDQLRTWLETDRRYATFYAAMLIIDNEQVPGDIFEFGVGVGRSLALLSYCHKSNLHYYPYLQNDALMKRRFVGFDTFSGLPDAEEHPRWYKGLFGRNYEDQHPLLAWDEPITQNSIYTIFDLLKLPEPKLHKGLFDKVLPEVIYNYQKAALIHIDCDLYYGTKVALDALEPLIQPGTFILFDDYFCFKGDPKRGEAGAFNDFLAEHKDWQPIHYRQYSVYSNSFILHRR
jgi:hypothetical protein